MRKTFHVYILALILTTIGACIFYYKVTQLEFPLVPDTRYESWYIETNINFTPKISYRDTNKPVTITLKLPVGSEHLAVVDDTFIADGFGREVSRDNTQHNRLGILTKRNSRAQETILHRAIIYKLDSPAESRTRNNVLPEADTRYAPVKRDDLTSPPDAAFFVALDSLISEAKSRSASKTSFAREIYRLAKQSGDSRINVIASELKIPNETQNIANFLLNTSGTAARIVHGLELVDQKRYARFTKWVEFHDDRTWRAFDPNSGKLGLESIYLPWWYGDDTGFLSAEGVSKSNFSITIRRNTDNSLTRAMWKTEQAADILLTFSFFNLSLQSQLVLKILLLIPIGGLIISFLRQVIGLKTFGTFMPVLIALAFRDLGLASGLLFFGIIITIGLLIRGYFDRLELLMVPRLSAVLTIVVLAIGFLEVMGNAYGIGATVSLSLFPIVIMTMVVERMSLLWEEFGANEALKTGFYSALSAVLCYVVISPPIVGHLVFVFPELLLIVLAANLMLGRYNGYKLMEYFRFKSLEREIRRNGNHP
jgi:hypothetical protein